MNYFAYGSNMFLGWLRSRVPSAKFLQVIKLSGYTLKFHKRSTDGSGKCNALQTGKVDDVIYGILYEIDKREKHRLDEAEGLGKGYNEKIIELVDGLKAFIYIADKNYINDGLKPFVWYKDIVVAGAKQNSLPDDYIKVLKSIETQNDPDKQREAKNQQFLENQP